MKLRTDYFQWTKTVVGKYFQETIAKYQNYANEGKRDLGKNTAEELFTIAMQSLWGVCWLACYGAIWTKIQILSL